MDWFEFVLYCVLVILALLVVLVLPLVGAVIIAMFLANLIGFSGLAWWCVVMAFYLIILGLMYPRVKE